MSQVPCFSGDFDTNFCFCEAVVDESLFRKQQINDASDEHFFNVTSDYFLIYFHVQY